MPCDQSEPCSDTAPSSEGRSSPSLPHLSLKAGLAVFLPAGLFLSALSHYNFLLIHALLELTTGVLLTAMFLIGWKTRNLVRSQFFLILSVGLFVAGLVGFLHALTFSGVLIVPAAGTDTAAQLWLIARTLGFLAIFLAIFSLGRKDFCTARQWLVGFLSVGAILMVLVWPLGIFPVCFVEGVGPTPFQATCEYLIIGLLCLATCLLWRQNRHLNRHVLVFLLLSIGLNVVSELMLTLSVAGKDFMSFVGHYFKLGSAVLVYSALAEGTLNSPLSAYYRDVSRSYEELNRELQRRVAAEK